MNLKTLTISMELTPFFWGIEACKDRWIGGGSAWVQIGPLLFSVAWENG